MEADPVFASSPVAQLVLAADHRVRAANRAWIARTGLDPHGRPWVDLVHPADHDAEMSLLERLQSCGSGHRLATRIATGDGGWIAATVEATAIGDGALVTILPAAPVPEAVAEERHVLAAALSHDLRQHARLVASYLSLLARAPLAGTERERLNTAVDHNARLLASLAGMVRWLRLTDQPVDRSRCDLAAVAARAAQAVPGLDLAVGDLPVVDADPLLIEELLQAVLVNATRYGAPPVAISAARSGDCWDIAIADHGPGIPPDERIRVLGPLRRLHTWEDAPGHGMGLAIASRIASRHGGMLVIDETPGGGCSVHLRLPAG